MHIYVYSDESGVLDKKHCRYFVFGGLVFLSKDERDLWSRKYVSAEKNISQAERIDRSQEVKASSISNESKSKLYKSLKKAERFGIVIRQEAVEDAFFVHKKTKQRYLDWAYKVAVKKKLEEMIRRKCFDPAEVTEITFMVDEHSTATNGIYELHEALEHELKIGTTNYDKNAFYPPLFPNLQDVKLQYCNSAKTTLIRAADIVANRLYYLSMANNGIILPEERLHIMYHPYRHK